MPEPQKEKSNPSASVTASAPRGGWHPISFLFRWIGGHDRGVLGGLLVVTLSISVFLTIADHVTDGETLPIDEWLLRALRQPDNPSLPVGPDWMLEVGRDISALGGVTFLTLLTIAISGFLIHRRMYGAVTLVVGSTLGALLLSTLLKNLFDRPRPTLVAHLMQVHSSSFPSGHSMLSATVYLTLGTLLGQFVQERFLKAYFLLVALTLTTLVGISRVFLGVHYPSDVVAGWSAGLAWALCCTLLARYLQRRGAVEKAS